MENMAFVSEIFEMVTTLVVSIMRVRLLSSVEAC